MSAAVAHLHPRFHDYAERVHRHMLRAPGKRTKYGSGEDNRVWCSCGRGTVTLSASNRGEVCYVCKVHGRLRLWCRPQGHAAHPRTLMGESSREPARNQPR